MSPLFSAPYQGTFIIANHYYIYCSITTRVPTKVRWEYEQETIPLFPECEAKKGPETCNSHSTGDTDVFCSHSLMLIHFLRERLYIIRIYSCHEAMIMEKTRFLLRFISACQSYIMYWWPSHDLSIIVKHDARRCQLSRQGSISSHPFFKRTSQYL